jgi:hypothetical protein
MSAYEDLAEGLAAGDLHLYAVGAHGGGAGMVDAEVRVRRGGDDAYLMMCKMFSGAGEYHRPWTELYNVRESVNLGNAEIGYVDSALEDALLGFFAKSLSGGGKLFVEYLHDEETAVGLKRGFPEAVTRLGYKMLRVGFTWFKDWYYPEGFREGGRKLQGEKPLDEENRSRQLRKIGREVEDFLQRTPESEPADAYWERAGRRARGVLEQIDAAVSPA